MELKNASLQIFPKIGGAKEKIKGKKRQTKKKKKKKNKRKEIIKYHVFQI